MFVHELTATNRKNKQSTDQSRKRKYHQQQHSDVCVCVYALLVLFDGKCLKRQRYSPALSFPPFYISVIVITVAATAAP